MKCACGRKAVVFRKYEGSGFCGPHFVTNIESKVKRTIRKYKMIGRGDRIAFALSGGKDSSAILEMLVRIFGKRDDLKFFAVSIDEGIPGYRDRSLANARKLCKRLGVEHHVVSFEEGFGKKLSDKIKKSKDSKGVYWEGGPCTFCGVGRRYLLNRKARELGATKLCTGHNLDDEIQSIMMDYLKGDLGKLARMGGEVVGAKDFIPRIKPFREIPEKEIGLYAVLRGLDVQEEECPHMEGPRFKVRDFLNSMEEESPGIKFSVLKTFERLLPSIKESVKGEGKIGQCGKCGEPAAGKVCKACLLWGTGA